MTRVCGAVVKQPEPGPRVLRGNANASLSPSRVVVPPSALPRPLVPLSKADQPQEEPIPVQRHPHAAKLHLLVPFPVHRRLFQLIVDDAV